MPDAGIGGPGSALPPWDLANTVTGWCTLGSGLVCLALVRWLGPQPGRWVFVWACLVLTGIPTVLFHGFGGEPLRVADTGSNLLLAWAIQLAVLGDFYAPSTRRRVGWASGLANLAGVAWMAREAATGIKQPLLSFGEFGGFYAGEVLLIADSLLVVGLFYARRGRIEARAMPLLHLVTATFLVGLGLATASNQTVHGRIFSYHALWHIVGAFGFVLLWAFNHARRHPATPASADRPG